MKHLKSLALAAAFIAPLIFTTPAAAWIACNPNGDCWYVGDEKFTLPNIKLTIFPDSELERIKADKRYVWHPKDNLHNWLSGYWLYGNWYTR